MRAKISLGTPTVKGPKFDNQSRANGVRNTLVPKNYLNVQSKNSSAITEGIPKTPSIEKARVDIQQRLTTVGSSGSTGSSGISN